jgi:lysyl-tRNA synthetase class 1
LAHLPQTVMADDHIAAKVGSVENDPYGRLLQRTSASFALSGIWLQVALERAIEPQEAMPEHFVSWANRLDLFDDVTYLIEGVRAWYERDLAKAVHVLVPQIERGLRGIVAKLGKPVTKPHPGDAGVGVAIGMGDILYSDEIIQALGPDLTLYLLALYADPHGLNLRNRVAHGLIKLEAIDENLVRLLIHTLLVFGVWKELAERRR